MPGMPLAIPGISPYGGLPGGLPVHGMPGTMPVAMPGAMHGAMPGALPGQSIGLPGTPGGLMQVMRRVVMFNFKKITVR